jgi:hypoxanthine phosphoribosyltransferase
MNPSAVQYLEDLDILKKKIMLWKIDAIVSLKRSGWIAGAYLSNKLNIPVFTPSEIPSIPGNFLNILVVDDKIWSGKSMQKVLNKLRNKHTATAVLYLEEGYRMAVDVWVREIPRKGCRMWYELGAY